MGVVYRAIDSRLKRTVAIKLLPPNLTQNAIAKQRFRQEAQAASALDHRNICTVHDINELEDGRLYLVMAHYEGETLKQRIARGVLPPDEAVTIALQIGEGLMAAHARGIVHRDIKPANVMVLTDGTAKILDFGLAKLVGHEELTHSGVAVGTLAYMSPEQMRGHEVDHRTDIYSFGVVLYEMLTGDRPPPDGTERQALTDHALDLIAARALAPDRHQRYPTVNSLTEDLRSWRSGTADATGAGGGDGPSIAVLAFANMSADPENEFLADGISEEIINTLGQIKELRVAARGSSFFFKGQPVDLRDVGRKLRVGSVLEGSVRKAGTRLRITAELVDTRNGYQLWSERYDRELKDIFDVQDEIARTIADRLQIALVDNTEKPLVRRATRDLNAYEAYLKGRALLYKRGRMIPAAIKCFEEAVALDPKYALSWAGLADGCIALGHYGLIASRAPLAQGKAAALKAVELDGSLTETRCSLAMATLVHDFDLPAAKREFLHALELNPNYPQAVAWYSLWVLSFIEGRFDEAVDLMRSVVEHDPLFGYNHRVWAAQLAFSGRHDEAIAESLTAIALEPESFMPYWTLLMSYSLAGRYPEAIAAGHAALMVSGRHPFVMMVLGATFANCGKDTEARMLFDELVKRADTQWVSPALWASVAATAGLAKEAIALTERAALERDPQLLSMLFAYPLSSQLRGVLADAGRLDDFRRGCGAGLQARPT